MNVFNHIKADARIAPVFSIISYYLFVAFDIYTTYLASPDLRYEGNWFIRYFNLSWSQIIIKDSFIVLIISTGLFIALDYIHKYYRENIRYSHSFIVEIFCKTKILMCFIIVCCFYSHLFYSIFVTLNNYLSYIYLDKINSFLSRMSTFYVNKIIMSFPHIFTWYNIFFISVAFVFTILKFKRIENKYRSISI